MNDTVSISRARRRFFRLLREVRKGRSFTVTSNGQPVAWIVTASQRDNEPDLAWQRLLTRLRQQVAEPSPRTWTRENLYED